MDGLRAFFDTNWEAKVFSELRNRKKFNVTVSTIIT